VERARGKTKVTLYSRILSKPTLKGEEHTETGSSEKLQGQTEIYKKKKEGVRRKTAFCASRSNTFGGWELETGNWRENQEKQKGMQKSTFNKIRNNKTGQRGAIAIERKHG